MRLSNTLFSDGEPVPEREARALAVYDALDDHLVEHVEEQWTVLKWGIAGAAVAVLAGLGLLFAGSTGAGAAVSALGLAAAGGSYYYADGRDPDVTVTGVEKGYWTGHLVPDGDEVVVFDATESVPNSEFRVDLLPEAERAHEVKGQLDEFDEFPVLLSEDRDVEAEFLDTLSDVERAIDEAETHEIRAPLLEGSDPAVDSLFRLASEADSDPIDAGGVSLSPSEADERVDALTDFEQMVDEDRGESVLLEVSEQCRELAGELSGHQEAAVGLLNDHLSTAGDYFGLVTYNFYCPDCLDDDIDSELEPVDDEWFCDVCRSHYPQGVGVPRHAIRDDLVLDITDRLWIEKDDQLREVYENIEDQKADLEEREFEQRREEIRTVGDRINDVRSRIRDLKTEAKAKRGSIDRIGELMVEHERLAEQKQREFREDVQRSYEEIERETQAAIEETRDVVEGRIEEAEKEAGEKAELMREEERALEREKLAYQQSMEAERTKAQMQQQQQQHEQQQAAAVETIKRMDEGKGRMDRNGGER